MFAVSRAFSSIFFFFFVILFNFSLLKGRTYRTVESVPAFKIVPHRNVGAHRNPKPLFSVLRNAEPSLSIQALPL